MIIYLDENDRRANGEKTVKFDKHLIFMFIAFTVKVELSNTLDGELFVLESELVSVRSEFCRIADDVVGEGS